MEKVYSIDGEQFSDLSSVMDELRDDEDLNIGDSVEIKEGVAVKPEHSEFISGFDWIEELQNRAYDEHGEWSEDYLCDIDRENVGELELLVADWLSKNAKPPTFYKVTGIKDIQVVVE